MKLNLITSAAHRAHSRRAHQLWYTAWVRGSGHGRASLGPELPHTLRWLAMAAPGQRARQILQPNAPSPPPPACDPTYLSSYEIDNKNISARKFKFYSSTAPRIMEHGEHNKMSARNLTIIKEWMMR